MTRRMLVVVSFGLVVGSAALSEAQSPGPLPSNQAVQLREQFQRWLDENHQTLRADQVATVREAIALVSVDMYRLPPDQRAAMQQRADAMSTKVFCSLGADLAYSFANGLAPTKRDKTWREVVHEWYEWAAGCALNQ